MNLCFLCNEYPPAPHGGIGRFTSVLATALAARGHHVRVIGAYAGAQRPSCEEQDGVAVWRLPLENGIAGALHARVSLFRHVADWARHGSIDLVEAPDYEGWCAAWPRLPIPVLLRLHGSATYFLDELDAPLQRKLCWVERSSLLRAGHHLATSIYVDHRTRQVFRFNRPALGIAYNGVAVPEEFPPRAPDPELVVFSGTLTGKKGVFSLARAWKHVVRRIPRAELHLFGKDTRVGGISTRRQIEDIAGDCGGSLVFHGHKPLRALDHFYRVAGVAVFPSYAEAFALAPLEAMAQGCPAVYTLRGSGAELIEHGVNGLLVDPDDEYAIAAAILRVLLDEQAASSMGRAGWDTVRTRFSLPAVCEQNERFFLQVLNHPV